jgi:uncharacterized protein YhhL (DUF1145 family)
LGTQYTGRRQSRDTDNIGYTRHRTKTIHRHRQHWVHKTQDEDNPETLTTLGTPDTGRRQSRDTDNIGYTRHRTPTIQSVLSSSCVLCTQCCQCLWIVVVLCLVYPMLPVSLDCLRPVSCVPNVVSVSGLSSSCVLCTQCCQCLWIVFVLCLVYPMLGRRQPRDTDNIGYTRHRTTTIQRH